MSSPHSRTLVHVSGGREPYFWVSARGLKLKGEERERLLALMVAMKPAVKS